ncbi:hemerythrin domain-containing protein [Actinoplanes solisilvae]|uniref:hemerythrin domain-containing protein n=1 Tax=Actinoplanes solisilvae TaxID=2486853 RepID=UPI000FDC06EF|nr:hemerythrin domain-containing protein [Actinoplanes solisilvae]
MQSFKIVVSPDIVDALRREHEQIRQLCVDVRGSERGRKKYLLAKLQQAVHLHQLGETTVAHPAVRNTGPRGDAVALGSQVKGAQIDRSLTELARLGVEHPDFDTRFASLSDALRDHAAEQERDEFPLLRSHVPADRLHMMASAMRDVQIMALDGEAALTL